MAQAPQSKEPMTWGEIVGFALLATVVLVLVFSGRNGTNASPVPVGTPFPPLMAEGWLNSVEPITREQLDGKVVVVDCWATWCPPCRAAIPELVMLHEKYEPLGVQFLGLTSETSHDRTLIGQFVASIDGFDWPIGYGTMPMQDMLGIQALPTVIVFDSTGRVVWSSNFLYGIEEALDQALASAQ